MLIMPIINKDRILNVELRLKKAKKIKTKVHFSDIAPSDIIVNYSSFLQSSYNIKNQKLAKIPEFIRYHGHSSKSDFYISTKEETNSPYYDLYQVAFPPSKITEGLDNFYGSLILDLKSETPNNIKGRYLDLKKIKVTEHITEERLAKLANILENYTSQKRITDNDLEDLIETLEFLDLVDCRIIAGTSIDIKDFQKVYNCLAYTNTQEARDINNYYNIARNNQEAYSKLSKLYNIVHNDSLNWIRNDNKVMIKTDKIKL